MAMKIPIGRVIPNPEQPRKAFDAENLASLAASIAQQGVIQPIIVEAHGDDYILHDGERRLRAAKMAGLLEIPAEITPPLNGSGGRKRLVRALVANVQREDMNPVEEAHAYRRLRDEFGFATARAVADETGVAYVRVANLLRIIRLEPEIQALIAEKKLPADQVAVRALLSIPAGEARITLAQTLAERRATIEMVRTACGRYNKHLQGMETTGKLETPAIDLARREAAPRRELPEWDILAQTGQAPPWEIVASAASRTCGACALRDVASAATCQECPLLDHLRILMEAAHVK